MSDGIDVLRERLDTLGTGRIEGETRGEVESLLVAAWNDLDGDDGGMEPRKLYGRTENMAWDPPRLTFEIERHGATVLGSVYAHVQPWEINLEAGTATVGSERRRLVGERQAAWDEQPVADELAKAMREGREDERLRWASTGRVQIRTSDVLPSAPKETTEGRRKRLNDALGERLMPEGWTRAGAWWTPPDHES